MDIQIKSLKGVNPHHLFIAFSRAFEDYEMQLNEEEFYRMIFRRGFIDELSFAAFSGNHILAFTLNGIGDFNGMKTAYDTGTGTLKEYRGRGLAGKIFEYSIPYLKKAGVKQYLLEVLQHNTAALKVYKKLGFKVNREFNYFVKSSEDFKVERAIEFYKFQLEPIQINKNDVSGFWDFNPSWQNSFDAINRKADHFETWGAKDGEKIIAYMIFDPKSGDISQLAVDPNYRRQGLGKRLLNKAFETNKNCVIKIINTEKDCSSVNAFLKNQGILSSGQQFEMILELD